MMKKPALALVLTLAGGCLGASPMAFAQTVEAPRPYTVELSSDNQRLSNNSPDWQETTLRLNRSLAQRQLVEVSLVQSNRFGLRDEQLQAVYVHPLTDKLGATLDASFSPTHNFLAQRSLGMTLNYEFAPAWLVYVGAKNTQYNDASVDQGLLMVERYFGSFSAAAAWRPVRAFGTSTSSQELRGSYYYGDKNVVGLILSSGQEAAQISSTQIALADVKSTALTGRHWVSRDWAFTYALNSTRQGDFYTRNGLRIGVQYIF
jgi:YaiO family outer membrane protein